MSEGEADLPGSHAGRECWMGRVRGRPACLRFSCRSVPVFVRPRTRPWPVSPTTDFLPVAPSRNRNLSSTAKQQMPEMSRHEFIAYVTKRTRPPGPACCTISVGSTFPAGSTTTLNRTSISLNTFHFDIKQNISVQLSQNKSAIKTVGRITRIAAILKNKTLQNKLKIHYKVVEKQK